jgi:hypothetical protein
MKEPKNCQTLDLSNLYQKYKRVYIFLPGEYDWSIMGMCEATAIGCNVKEDILKCYENFSKEALETIWKMKPNTFKVVDMNEPNPSYDDYGKFSVFRINIEHYD